jgi:16S rRNA processing protein RimM
MTQEDEYIEMGRISGLYGVRGWVKVYSYTDPRENILNYATWHLRRQDRWVPVKLADGRGQGKGVVAHLEGYDDRDAAAALVGTTIAVLRSELPATGEGEYYWSDLIGLRVINRQGVELGTVADLMETGANDVLVVKGERERLIPYTPGEAVQSVDLAAGLLTVDWDADFE